MIKMKYDMPDISRNTAKKMYLGLMGSLLLMLAAVQLCPIYI